MNWFCKKTENKLSSFGLLDTYPQEFHLTFGVWHPISQRRSHDRELPLQPKLKNCRMFCSTPAPKDEFFFFPAISKATTNQLRKNNPIHRKLWESHISSKIWSNPRALKKTLVHNSTSVTLTNKGRSGHGFNDRWTTDLNCGKASIFCRVWQLFNLHLTWTNRLRSQIFKLIQSQRVDVDRWEEVDRDTERPSGSPARL